MLQKKYFRFLFILFLSFVFGAHTQAHTTADTTRNFISKLLLPSENFNKKRFLTLNIGGAAAYGGAILVLDQVWYAQYPRGKFQFFDDGLEWRGIDKCGHVLTAYTEAKWAYEAYRWAGVRDRRAALLGMTVGTAFQASLEILDGFSTNWGFSWTDIAANTSGCVLFGVQQAVWGDQRLLLKVSNAPKKYDNSPLLSDDKTTQTTLRTRAFDLYGNTFSQSFFKDYNALTFWISGSPNSFGATKFPKWLNVAVGYGAENMYGGFTNNWSAKGKTYSYNEPRYQQFYLSLDIDLTKIKTKNRFLKALCKTFNFVKIPAPTLEWNTTGKMRLHPLMF